MDHRAFAGDVVIEVDGSIVADVEVKPAVAVDVAPGAAGGPVGVGDLRFGGDVAEAAAARRRRVGDIVEQTDPAEIGDDEIVEAVVIEVADGAAHAVTGLVEADRGRHIGEGAVAVVSV